MAFYISVYAAQRIVYRTRGLLHYYTSALCLGVRVGYSFGELIGWDWLKLVPGERSTWLVLLAPAILVLLLQQQRVTLQQTLAG